MHKQSDIEAASVTDLTEYRKADERAREKLLRKNPERVHRPLESGSLHDALNRVACNLSALKCVLARDGASRETVRAGLHQAMKDIDHLIYAVKKRWRVKLPKKKRAS